MILNEFPFTDRLEVNDEVGQNMAALGLEVVVQAKECLLDLGFGNLCDGTGGLVAVMAHTEPVPCGC